MFSLKEKVAVVTGGGSGVGLAIAKRFIRAGARVIIADISDKAQLIADEIGAVFVKTDVSKEEDIKNLFEKASGHDGKIDIVINNAGIALEEQFIVDSNAEDFKKCFEINLLGVLHGIKNAPVYMKDGGAIVNVASLAGKIGVVGNASYNVSKAGVIELTKTAALELVDNNIRVNCVCPATINTPMAHQEGQETLLALNDGLYPQRRMGEPEEVAALVHFLASDDCNYIIGQDINIDGGYTAGIGISTVEAILKGVGVE